MQVGKIKIYRQIFYMAVMSVVTIACKKPPEFPTTPEISFVSISKTIVFEDQGPNEVVKSDSVTISIYFKDGNGDLGSINASNENYFCKVYLKQGNEFNVLLDSTRYDSLTKKQIVIPLTKNGTYPPLNPDGRLGPIEGTLNFSPSLRLLAVLPNLNKYTLKFEVYILDNAGNKSNTVETSPIDIEVYD